MKFQKLVAMFMYRAYRMLALLVYDNLTPSDKNRLTLYRPTLLERAMDAIENYEEFENEIKAEYFDSPRYDQEKEIARITASATKAFQSTGSGFQTPRFTGGIEIEKVVRFILAEHEIEVISHERQNS